MLSESEAEYDTAAGTLLSRLANGIAYLCLTDTMAQIDDDRICL